MGRFPPVTVIIQMLKIFYEDVTFIVFFNI